MKPKQFKGWRRVKPREILRADDRWSYSPRAYDSPESMFLVSDSSSLMVGKRIPPSYFVTAPLAVYRRKDESCES